jgi:hypothetical protein
MGFELRSFETKETEAERIGLTAHWRVANRRLACQPIGARSRYCVDNKR